MIFDGPPKFCISIVFVSSWDHCKSQEELETKLIQNLGEQTKSIMVFSEAAYIVLPISKWKKSFNFYSVMVQIKW